MATATTFDATRRDEDLMRDLAAGQQEALGPLYSRYAALVFQVANHSLGQAAAEELVQEVFLTIWRGAAGFDASQGAFRPWLLRLTHWKILNELRSRRRQPTTTDDSPDYVVDAEPGPEERASRSEHEAIVKSALAALPAKQRQAIAMAFLEDMTHEQVARALDVPLGTAKTRIRSGLHLMRGYLAPMAASLLGLALAVIGFGYAQTQVQLNRDERALDQVTTSDVVPLRLTPTSANVPAAAHANYRGRPGSNLAVLTTELLPPGTYTAWVRHENSWASLGTFTPNGEGVARVISENDALKTTPDEVRITSGEPNGAASPVGEVVLSWSAP